MKKYIISLCLMSSFFIGSLSHAVDWNSLDAVQIHDKDRLNPISNFGDYALLSDDLKVMLVDLGNKTEKFRNQSYQSKVLGIDIKDGKNVFRVYESGVVNLGKSQITMMYWDKNIVVLSVLIGNVEFLHGNYLLDERLIVYNRATHAVLSKSVASSSVEKNSNFQHDDYAYRLLDSSIWNVYMSKERTYIFKGNLIHTQLMTNNQYKEIREPFYFTLKLDSKNKFGLKCVQASDDCNNIGSEMAIQKIDTPMN